MRSTLVSEFEEGLGAVFEHGLLTPHTGIAIFVEDAAQRRCIQQASDQLELVSITLDEAFLDLDAIHTFELIVADEAIARRLIGLFAAREEGGDDLKPAIIAVLPGNAHDHAAEYNDRSFDGILFLPQDSAPVLSQLVSLLYTQRALARRYRTALTELHLSRHLFRSVKSGICIASATLPDMPLVYVNPAFEAMTGYNFAEVKGRNCRFLQGTDRDQPALTPIREAFANKREVMTVVKNFHKDGTPFWNELLLSPVFNRNDELTHYIGIQTDITARVEFEIALRESEKLAAVGRLAASIAHEINNPLEAVTNLIYIAQSTDCSPETQAYLAAADKELQRVALIVAQSLRFSKQSTLPRAVRCKDLLDSALSLYQPRLHNAAIAVERRERSTDSLVCMESEIRQVLSNLISNAIDAMSGSRKRLHIRSRDGIDRRTGTRGFMITIADSGSGITPDAAKNIYKAFYSTKGIGGTGLGLWISSEIVERHRGRLTLRSTQQQGQSGTVFQLFLPYDGFRTPVRQAV